MTAPTSLTERIAAMNGPTRYLLIATPICIVVFLTLSSYFTAWGGSAISHRPTKVEDPAVLRVLIVSESREWVEQDWPAEVVLELGLTADRTGVPPVNLPEDAPTTLKERFSFHFEVSPNEGPKKIVSTLSARALSASILLWIAGFFLNNMFISGSPWSYTPRAFELPKNLPTGSETTTQERPATRGRKGPPPPKRRRGQGRRR